MSIKVKIGGKIYDSENEPILLIMNQQDKDNISNMKKNNTMYCAYPVDTPEYDIIQFMGSAAEEVK